MLGCWQMEVIPKMFQETLKAIKENGIDHEDS